MHIFISAGEPSGDLHGSNLARALRGRSADLTLTGFGGPLMRAAGVKLEYPLAEQAVMGFAGVARVLPELMDLMERVTAAWHRRRPDVVVLIDYPGFHWHLAARAKALEIPVVSFVPPQIWGWMSCRVRRMRRTFDHVLCALPFEERWFRRHGLDARYIGHPYFDELPRQRLNAAFLSGQRALGNPIVALLPGSRSREIRDNLETLIGTAQHVHEGVPSARFLFACFRESHGDAVRLRLKHEDLSAEVHVGRTAEIIDLADACVAVSGSVGLELLAKAKPTVVIYRTTRFYSFLTRLLKNVPYFSIVNLLADRELFPEYLLARDESAATGRHVVEWLTDRATAQRVRSELVDLRAQVAQPGACEAAAEFLTWTFGRRRAQAA